MNDVSTWRIDYLIKSIDDGSLELQPSFQRRLVWTNIVKDHFLETVIRGLPFPEIFVATGKIDTASMARKNLLVDGQQRVSTLREYVQGAQDLVLTKVMPYKDLPVADKEKFLDYKVSVRDLGIVTEDEIKEIFARINSTDYALRAMERLNAQFNGEYMRFCEQLSKHAFFARHKIFSLADFRRMRDLDFCVILTTTLLSTYYHRDAHNKEYLERYNDSFPQRDELSQQIEVTLDFIENCNFDKKCRIWKKTDLFTLMVELNSLLSKGTPLNPTRAKQKLTDFYQQVDRMYAAIEPNEQLEEKESASNVFRYLKAATKATNDKYARVDRAEVIASILQSTLAPDPLDDASKKKLAKKKKASKKREGDQL